MNDHFGGWSIDQKVFGWILSNLRIGSSILELGSGFSTGELSRYYQMNSIEDADSYLDKHKSNYIYAKSDSGWYNRAALESELPKIKYDLLIIDGPEHPKRHRFMEHLDLFDLKKPIIIDDCQEGDVLLMASKLAKDCCNRELTIINGFGTEKDAPKMSGVIA